MRADNARFTRSPPSTVPILTNEFVIADLLKFKPYDAALCPLPRVLEVEEEEEEALCREHRNEPGCVVGEHEHVFF